MALQTYVRPQILALITALVALPALAQQTLEVTETPIIEWKSVYGRVEARDQVPARARIGGTAEALDVVEGDRVEQGQQIALVEDNKLQFQIDAIDGRLESLTAQLETAQADLERGTSLRERGVITAQRLDQLQTAVDVIEGEIRGLTSERQVVMQQIDEGKVLSPATGVVLSVPISRGSVVVPGEAVAVIAGGGVYLRLAIPERYAGDLQEGADIEIGTGADSERQTGRLVKLYPQIEGGRVQADVEVEGLDGRFVGRRMPVRLPVAERQAILIPEAALHRSGGLDFVAVQDDRAALDRVVVPGAEVVREGVAWREILTGLAAGDTIVIAE
ncbi:efflux RND transporter periplasmic adaptor subunit [Sagittula sp. S175]|uniref:efflux RND transporter periplasmic adaptor subunit n=1 Tax=Sagittula sp. S175 TaxID=3415129 RepID=UPI003C7E3DA9